MSTSLTDHNLTFLSSHHLTIVQIIFTCILLYIVIHIVIILVTHGKRKVGFKNSAAYVNEKINRYLLKSSTELAKCIKINTQLNAVVSNRYEHALLEAKLADEILSKCKDTSKLPPYHGVPTTIKECFAVIDMPQSAGLVSRKNYISNVDATVVSRLRSAGFIITAVTNTSELCMWMESFNNVYGRTNNPYDHGRTVGGSSGGEAAMIAACGSSSGLGSDVGGSIRMPAFFNGIYGHKPTGGCVPNTGAHPLPVFEIQKVCQPGPLCRYPEDLYPLLKIMSGPDGIDTLCYDFDVPDPNYVNISALKIYNINIAKSYGMGKFLLSRCDEELIEAKDQAAAHLASVGCEVEDLVLPELFYSFEMWSAVLSCSSQPPFRVTLEKEGFQPIYELMYMIFGLKSVNTIPSLVLALLERVTEAFPSVSRKFFNDAKIFREKLIKIMGNNGVILYPPHPILAPIHDYALWYPFNFSYTAIFNATAFPVTSVPLGLSKEGLPLGVQVVSAPEHDHFTIAVALELHKKFGGWQFPK